MNKFKNASYFIPLLFVFFNCASSHKVAAQRGAKAKELPRDVRWLTQSVEYAALTTQVYRTAWPIVKEAALSQTENWVVVFDVDETVLDNSQYAVERVAVDSGYTQQSWTNWVRRKESPAVPGASAFIDSVRSLGAHAHVAFITDRKSFNEQPTIENLKVQGLLQAGDLVLTKTGPEDSKEDRRRCLAAGTGRCGKTGPMVIIAMFGDNIRDFMPMQGLENAKNYRQNDLLKDDRWGKIFFMLPNPNYGSWERGYQ